MSLEEKMLKGNNIERILEAIARENQEKTTDKVTTVTFKTTQEIKTEAEEFFSSVGLNMSSGINLYLSNVAQNKKLPFTIEKKEKEAIPVDLIFVKENGHKYHLINVICNSVSYNDIPLLAHKYIIENEDYNGKAEELIKNIMAMGYDFSVVPRDAEIKVSVADIQKISKDDIIIKDVKYKVERAEYKDVPINNDTLLCLHYKHNAKGFVYNKSSIFSSKVFSTEELAKYMTNLIVKKHNDRDVLNQIPIEALSSINWKEFDDIDSDYYKMHGLIVTVKAYLDGSYYRCTICDENKSIESYLECDDYIYLLNNAPKRMSKT